MTPQQTLLERLAEEKAKQPQKKREFPPEDKYPQNKTLSDGDIIKPKEITAIREQIYGIDKGFRKPTKRYHYEFANKNITLIVPSSVHNTILNLTIKNPGKNLIFHISKTGTGINTEYGVTAEIQPENKKKKKNETTSPTTNK